MKFHLKDLKKLLPAHVNSASQYWGSFVKINGFDSLQNSLTIRLLYCDWTISQHDNCIACSFESKEANQSGLDTLLGHSIIKVLLDQQTHRITLHTENEIQIALTANLTEYEDDDQMLLIVLPNQYVSYNPTTGFIVEPRIGPSEEED